jgi:hypothetical protein
MALDVKRTHSKGAFADRYVAHDQESGRDVLVSVARADLGHLGQADQRRVIEKAQRYHGLMHPHICAQIDVGFTPSGQLWIAQELPEGADEAGPQAGEPEAAAPKGAEVLTHICEGLAYAHGRDLVHGALTVDSVLYDRDQTPKVADFGIAAVLYEAGALRQRAGQTSSAAPELIEGDEPTAASDVYALGALGIRLVAMGEDEPSELPRDALFRRAHHIPVGGLATALERALQEDPHNRFRSADEMLQQLRAAIRPGAPSRSPRRRRAVPARKREPLRPEMSHAKAFGLMLWAMLRSLLTLLLGLALIGAAVAGGLVLAFRSAPQLVVVPRIEGKPVAQAVALLEAQGLKGKIGRRVHDDEVPPNSVVSQQPYPGKEVREGRGVELVVSLGPTRAKVPKLVGKPRAEAKELLAQSNLRLGAVSRKRTDGKPDRILEQSPPPGKEVPVGSEVDITVSVAAQPASRPKAVRGPRAADVMVVVPEGPVIQRVRVEVHYPSKRYTVAYNRTHSPGDKVKVHVVAEGEAKVHILIDGDLVAEEDMPPPS